MHLTEDPENRLIKRAVRAVQCLKVVSPSIRDVWDFPLGKGLVRNVGIFSRLFPWVQLSGGKRGPGGGEERVSEEDSEPAPSSRRRLRVLVCAAQLQRPWSSTRRCCTSSGRMVPALPPKVLGGNRGLRCGLGVVGVWASRLAPVPSLCECVALRGGYPSQVSSVI